LARAALFAANFEIPAFRGFIAFALPGVLLEFGLRPETLTRDANATSGFRNTRNVGGGSPGFASSGGSRA
jgi:hypothetical protein